MGRASVSAVCGNVDPSVADAPDFQSLYRKYRPQSPEEVVGQEHVVRALVGAVRENRLAHAFLFCGPRGTGKTSTARILAKMVNCEKGPTPDPCGVCDQCVAIREGGHLDVVEIDAASHGGVDDARELRERAPTAPAMGREKVYILDEAQRLSREAFDALLKIFEEPPPGVRFVLATTEPHKMPATIVSRTQRFDFRRIATDTLADLVERVAKAEGLTIDRPVAELVARLAEGSAREAEKLLDQASLLGGGEVTEQSVLALVGGGQADSMFELADAVSVGDTKGVFEVVDRLVQDGTDLRHFTGQALTHFRDLLLVRSAPEEPAVVDADHERHGRLASQAAKFSTAELSRVLSLLVAAQTDMRWTTSPRLTLELALVRATVPESDPTPAGLSSRIERLERLAGVEPRPPASGEAASPKPREAGDGAANEASAQQESATDAEAPVRRAGLVERGVGRGLASRSKAGPTSVRSEEQAQEASSKDAPHAPSAASLDITSIRRSWPQLLDRLAEQRQMILRANLDSVTAAAYDGETLELAFPPGKKFAVQKVQSKEEEFREAFGDVFGVRPRIRCVARELLVDAPLVDVEEDPPATHADALAKLKAEFGAEEIEDAGGGP
jgi:DNA polymerase III subunit gamma/tau